MLGYLGFQPWCGGWAIGVDRDRLVAARRAGWSRDRHVGEPDVVMAHWVGKELEAPCGVTGAEVERPEWGFNGDGHLIVCCAHSDLEGCAPLGGVEGVAAEALERKSLVPRA